MLETPEVSDVDGTRTVPANAEKGALRQDSFSEKAEWAEAQAAADATTTAAEAASPMAATDGLEKGDAAAGMEAAALNYGCPMEELTPLQLESVNDIAELLESEVRALLNFT